MIFNAIKRNAKLVVAAGILFLGISEYSFAISVESSKVLENIRAAKLNVFNLKEVMQNEKLQETREAYEQALIRGRQAMLDKFGVSLRQLNINGVNVYEYIPETVVTETVILHVHGGAFVLLSAASSYGIPIQVAGICGVRVISVDYDLAPENKYSLMIDQIKLAIKGILSEKKCSNLVLLGESAGGALCLSAAYEISKEDLKIEKMILLSPWVDLSCDMISDDVDDPILRKENYLEVAASAVISDEHDRELSPFFLKYDSSRFPDILVQYGTKEILAEQTIRFCKLLKERGVSVEAESYRDLWHVFQSYSDLPESRKAMESIKKFISGF